MTWYTGDPTYDTVLAVAFAIVAVTAAIAPFVRTPYGRFADEKFGVSLDPRLGWFLMELPASVVFVYFYVQGSMPWLPFRSSSSSSGSLTTPTAASSCRSG